MEQKVTLYNLAQEYRDLENALLSSVDEETGEVDVDIASAVEKIQGDFNQKAVAVATVWRDFGRYVSDIKAEIDRLTALKKRVECEQKRVEDYLTQACETTGTVEIRGIYANISFRKSEQTVIDDESALPKEYVVEKITYSPDKTKIKAAIKAGREVQGAHIEVKNNIQIK